MTVYKLSLLLNILGAIHQGRPAYPGEGGGLEKPRKAGHLLLFLMKSYC